MEASNARVAGAGAAALLVALIATPAMAQLAIQEPGAYQQDRHSANIYSANYGT